MIVGVVAIMLQVAVRGGCGVVVRGVVVVVVVQGVVWRWRG